MDNERQTRARVLISQFLKRVDKDRPELPDSLGLFGDGLALESLEAAELSVLLEDTFGADPFTTGDRMPETIGDVVDFYAASSGE